MTDRRTADNKGVAIAGIPCIADTFVQGGISVHRMKFSANKPRHRTPRNRYTLCKLRQMQIYFRPKILLEKMGKMERKLLS